MAEIVDSVASITTELDMQEKQLAFKRTAKCIAELDCAIKKQIQNLNGHVKSVQKAKLDKEKQEHMKVEKAALASRSLELSQTAIHMQAGAKPKELALLHQLKTDSFEPILRKEVNHEMSLKSVRFNVATQKVIFVSGRERGNWEGQGSEAGETRTEPHANTMRIPCEPHVSPI